MKSPSEILSLAKALPSFATPSLHLSYNLFSQFFSGELTDEKVLQGAYMVYGWMPTMLRLKGPVQPVYGLARLGREGKVTKESLALCACTLNNSLVGTSKLLHFISPQLYPIWDSRVYRALFGKVPHRYRLEDPQVYLSFIDWAKDFQSSLGFEDVKCRFQEEAGYPVSDMRATEAVLYALGPRPRKLKA
jgi:hypothetical protein